LLPKLKEWLGDCELIGQEIPEIELVDGKYVRQAVHDNAE
jgi:hypothetical protein